MNKVILGWADISFLSEGESLERINEVSELRRKKVLANKTECGIIQSFGAGLLLEIMLKKQGVFRTDFITVGHGKPVLTGSMKFNISHSGKMVMCALSDCEVGCDIEELRTIRQGALTRAFSTGEQSYIGNDPYRFYTLWTAKESYIKYIGGTVASMRPDTIQILPNGNHMGIIGANVRIRSGSINDYVYAVCECSDNPESEFTVQDYSQELLRK